LKDIQITKKCRKRWKTWGSNGQMLSRSRWLIIGFASWLTLAGPSLLDAGQQESTPRTTPASSGKPVVNPAARNPTGQSSQTGPQLRSVGVKGAIDSGGYSAPAAIKTQSTLTKGMVNLQRRGLKRLYAIQPKLPCGLEPTIIHAVETNPGSFTDNYRAGAFYLQHALPTKALPYLKKAHSLNVGDIEAGRSLAVAELQTLDFANARDLLMQLESDNAELKELLGIAEEGLGAFEAAAEQFRLAADSDPSEENLFAQGTALLLLGDADRTSAVFQAATARFPQSMALTIGLGSALYNGGHAADALKNFWHAAELDPSDPTPYLFIVRILNGTGDENLAEATDKVKRLMKIAPNNPGADYAYASILWTANGSMPGEGQFQKIENLLKRAIALDSTFAEAHFELASFYAERGQYTAAIPEYRSAIEADPELVEAHYRLGQAYMHTGQREMAARELALHRSLNQKRKQSPGDLNISVPEQIARCGDGGLEKVAPVKTLQ
jgi:tetratricopeptide (TPR) repeat protein